MPRRLRLARAGRLMQKSGMSETPPHPPTQQTGRFFELFNEIGIIDQLSTTALEACLPDGVLVSHFGVINHLTRVSDGRTPLELARAFQVPKTTMTHTLAGLAARGWVEMRPHPEDKRSKQVWLTEAGRTFRAQSIQAVGAAFQPILGAFPPEDVDTILPILRKLRVILDKARD